MGEDRKSKCRADGRPAVRANHGRTAVHAGSSSNENELSEALRQPHHAREAISFLAQGVLEIAGQGHVVTEDLPASAVDPTAL